MEAQKTINEKLTEAKRKVDYFEAQLQREIGQLVMIASHSKVLSGIKEQAARFFANRRTLYIVGGVVLCYLIVRMFVGGRRRAASGSNGGVLVMNKQPGFWSTLIRTAVQTFLLHYARKFLMDYLNRQFDPAKGAAKAKA